MQAFLNSLKRAPTVSDSFFESPRNDKKFNNQETLLRASPKSTATESPIVEERVIFFT